MSSEPQGAGPGTAERILDATWDLFEQRGTNFTVADIATAVGISRQAVYLHFGSRSGLFLAAVQYRDQQSGIVEKFETAMRQSTGVTSLEAWMRVWLGYLPEVLVAAQALAGAAIVDEDAREAISDRMTLQRDSLKWVFERIETDGMLAKEWTPDEAAEIVWSLVHFDAWQHLVIEANWTPERFIASRFDLIRRLLRAPPAQ